MDNVQFLLQNLDNCEKITMILQDRLKMTLQSEKSMCELVAEKDSDFSIDKYIRACQWGYYYNSTKEKQNKFKEDFNKARKEFELKFLIEHIDELPHNLISSTLCTEAALEIIGSFDSTSNIELLKSMGVDTNIDI